MTTRLDMTPTTAMSDAGASRDLWITMSDGKRAKFAARVVDDVTGTVPRPYDDGVILCVQDIDARTAVDVLAELAWAGAVPIAFSLT